MERECMNTTEFDPFPLAEVQCKLLDDRLKEDQYRPSYGSQNAAGMDMRACIHEPLVIKPGETVMIPTGMAIYLENPSLAAMLLPRSGLGAKHGVVLGNLVGLIDSDYQGQMMIPCWNRNFSESITIQPMDRIAQMVVVPVFQLMLKEVTEWEASGRGENGFGSTGKH